MSSRNAAASAAADTAAVTTSSQNEIIAGNLWVAWQAVILQLSFVERYRALIVYHGEGEVFQHMKVGFSDWGIRVQIISCASEGGN